MKSVFYINDYSNNGDTDSQVIDKCLREISKISVHKTIVFNGKDYHIDKAILLPSNTTVIIDNCRIFQNDLVFDNIFRGDNLVIDENSPYDVPLDVLPLANVKIIGNGNAEIVGTKQPQTMYHPFFKENMLAVGDFWGYRTHSVSISNCNGFEISGLKLSNTMGWAICFDNCKNCNVHCLEIISNVKNGDGIDFRSGCNNCIVNNITGYTSDDTVACTALSNGKTNRPLSKYLYSSEPYNSCHKNIDKSIHNIKISNIFTGGKHHGVICLAANGNKLYNIEISNVFDGFDGERESSVRVYTGYGEDFMKGDIKDIKINNVTSNISKYAVMVTCETENLTVENLTQNNANGEIFYKV